MTERSSLRAFLGIAAIIGLFGSAHAATPVDLAPNAVKSSSYVLAEHQFLDDGTYEVRERVAWLWLRALTGVTARGTVARSAVVAPRVATAARPARPIQLTVRPNFGGGGYGHGGYTRSYGPTCAVGPGGRQACCNGPRPPQFFVERYPSHYRVQVVCR